MTGISRTPTRPAGGSGAAGRIRVLVVDDSALVRSLLTEMLGSAPDIEVVGVAPSFSRSLIRLSIA